jgi:hypothetical protein
MLWVSNIASEMARIFTIQFLSYENVFRKECNGSSDMKLWEINVTSTCELDVPQHGQFLRQTHRSISTHWETALYAELQVLAVFS